MEGGGGNLLQFISEHLHRRSGMSELQKEREETERAEGRKERAQINTPKRRSSKLVIMQLDVPPCVLNCNQSTKYTEQCVYRK